MLSTSYPSSPPGVTLGGRRDISGGVRETAEAIEPFIMGGGYINVLGREAEEGVDRIRAAFGENYERLVALKNKYDPTNLFRHNQNIKPAV
jgi:hypothetical protein